MLGCKLFSDVSMDLGGKENVNGTQTDNSQDPEGELQSSENELLCFSKAITLTLRFALFLPYTATCCIMAVWIFLEAFQGFCDPDVDYV